MRGSRKIKFSVVRYGNVMGSRGSVIPFFMEKRKTGVLPITDPSMTRFNICIEDGIRMVLWAISNSHGGEIFVPKIPSYRITDVAMAIGPECKHSVVGIRPGEKIHEEMITETDSLNTVDLGEYYAILPMLQNFQADVYANNYNGKLVKPGFTYNSGINNHFLTVSEIQHLIKNKLGLDI